MRGFAELEQAVPETVADRSGPAEQQSSGRLRKPRSARALTRPTAAWGPRQKLLLIGALVTLLGLGMAGYFHLIRVRLVDTKSMAPIQSWRLWHDWRYSIDHSPPWEEFYLTNTAAYWRRMAVAAVVAGVGVLVMASSLLAPSRRRGRRRRPPKAGTSGGRGAT
jgi:hypothetical protein